MQKPETRRMKTRRVAQHQPEGGWTLNLSDTEWALVMLALGVAIDQSRNDSERVRQWQQLRTAISAG